MNLPTLEAESAVLGTIAEFGETLPKIIDTGLRAAHFLTPSNSHAFRECLIAYDQGKPVDPVTVPELLGYVGIAPSLSRFETYARQVMEKARWREIARAADTLHQAYELEDEELLAEGERLLQTEYENEALFDRDRLSELLWNRLEKGTPPGWTMPLFPKLRLRRATVQLWGGHTSHGKTVWVDQVARHLHAQAAAVVLYLNEMTAEERMCRWASAVTGISLDAIEENKLSADEKGRVVKALSNVPFEIVECAGWRHHQIARDIRIRRPDVAIVDIIHEIPYRDERDLADIMRALTTTAKLANVAIIGTVHLNRARTEGAARPLPVMSDIKGASAFEQGADFVGMVWRKDDAVTGRPTNVGMIYGLKNRQGKLAGVDVVLDGDYARFELA